MKQLGLASFILEKVTVLDRTLRWPHDSPGVHALDNQSPLSWGKTSEYMMDYCSWD